MTVMIDYAAVAAARERDLAQASGVTCLTCQLVINGSQVSTSPQVGVRIEAARAAILDDGVEDGAALAGIGIAEEEPVFLSEHGGTNGVLDEIIVDFDSAVLRDRR